MNTICQDRDITAGSFEFACLIPGHFEAGMIGRITVKQGK